MFFGKLENFGEGGDALTGVFAAEPGAGIEAAQVGEGHIVHGAFSVGGAIDGFVVDGYQAGVAGQLQIGFDEGSAEGDSLLERSQCVFRRVPGGAAVRDQQHGRQPAGVAVATFLRTACFFNRYLNEARTGCIVTPATVLAGCTCMTGA